MDIYQLIRDLIEEAQKQKNLEMVDKLIDIKLSLSNLQDENRELHERIKELEESKITEADLELLPQGYYIKKRDPSFIEEDYLINCSKQLLNGELISDKHFLRVAILLGLLIFEDRELPTILSLYDQRKLQVRED